MNKETDKEEVVIKEVYQKGVFTVVEASQGNIIGIGLSRKCQGDKSQNDLGISIALGRAKKSIELKKANKFINNHYMG